ncbi:MAG: phosphoribosylglycinamide formyltransferase [Betaproteobacteria bacterium]|nr:phosphoribosylglycinamide formyltransferase [Betaproteobacteria bacterium]
MKSIVILISGRGSNMEALIDSELNARIAAVISNRPDAQGLVTARSRCIPTAVADHRSHASRESFDLALMQHIEPYRPDLIVLAGFMRILTERFVHAFQDRLINIHPSLLPAFPGTNTHQRALEEGVKVHGCTVHFVTSALDGGPIIAQAAVPVRDDDTPASLAARVLVQEHRILPAAVRWLLEDRIQLEGRRVRVARVAASDHVLTSPACS